MIIVNNREKNSWLFPFSLHRNRWHGSWTIDDALRTAGRAMSVMERSVSIFIGALPVADLAFVILVVAYVKAS